MRWSAHTHVVPAALAGPLVLSFRARQGIPARVTRSRWTRDSSLVRNNSVGPRLLVVARDWLPIAIIGVVPLPPYGSIVWKSLSCNVSQRLKDPLARFGIE